MIGMTRYVARAEIDRQSQIAADMAKLQESVSTGKRMSAGSDDPIAAGRVSEIRQDQANQAAWTRNATVGASAASAADKKLGSVADLLTRAKELILSGRNEATSAADRATNANELRGLATEIATYADSTDANGRPLFETNPLPIPVSESLSLTAAADRASVFDKVTTDAGVKSITDILNGAADALLLPDDAVRGTSATTSIAEVDASIDHIASVHTDQGVRMQRFGDASDRLSDKDVAATAERQSLEQTDTAYAYATFTSKDTQLKAAQAIFAQTHKQSLFDLLG